MNIKEKSLEKSFCYRASAFNHIRPEEYKSTFQSRVNAFEFDRIHKKVYQEYIDLFHLNRDSELSKYFGIASVKIVLLISHLIYDELLFNDLKNNKIDYILADKVDTLKKSLINSHKDIFKQFDNNYLTLKKIKAHLKFVKNHRTINLNFDSILNSNSLIYIGKKNKSVANFYSNSNSRNYLIDNKIFYPILKKVKLESLIESKLDNFFQRIITNFNLSENYFIKEKFKKIKYDLEVLYNFMNTAQKLTINKRSLGFYVHAIGHPINRFIAAGLRLSKNEVISDIHGNMDFTLRNSGERVIYGEFSICSQLIAKSSNEFDLAKDVNNHVLCADKKAKISLNIIKDDKFKKLKIRNKITGDIKKVMVVGFPHKPTFTVGQPHLNSITQITFEIDLCNHLKSSGYKVFYKCHPDRIDVARSVFKNKVDYFLTEKFEDCYSLCDCIFFTYASTTAFGFALRTDIPIVLFNFSTSDLNYENLTRIEKRCSISKINFDKRGYDKINISEINKLIIDAKNKILKH